MRELSLLLVFFVLSLCSLSAEPVRVAQSGIVAGTYETYFYGVNFTLEKFLGGDIKVFDGNRYRFQDGEGTFSLTGDNVVWQSGPLQGVITRYKVDSGGKPALVIPRKENEARGMKMAVSDIWGYLVNR